MKIKFKGVLGAARVVRKTEGNQMGGKMFSASLNSPHQETSGP